MATFEWDLDMATGTIDLENGAGLGGIGTGAIEDFDEVLALGAEHEAVAPRGVLDEQLRTEKRFKPHVRLSMTSGQCRRQKRDAEKDAGPHRKSHSRQHEPGPRNRSHIPPTLFAFQRRDAPDADRVVIRQDGRIVAEHRRAFGRGETVYDPWYYVPVARAQARRPAQRRAVQGLGAARGDGARAAPARWRR